MRQQIITGIALSLVCCSFFSCKKDQSAITSTPTSTSSIVKTANSVPESFAIRLALNLPNKYFGGAKPGTENNITEKTVKNVVTITDDAKHPIMYIVNFENNQGYAAISADYRLEPIYAIVDHGEYISNKSMPPGLADWFSTARKRFDEVISGKLDRSAIAAGSWRLMMTETKITEQSSSIWGGDPGNPSDPFPTNPPCDPTVVYESYIYGPWLHTRWGQSCSYNDNCPQMSCFSSCSVPDAALTGSAATAVAQMVRYWQPVTSANYIYSSMPVDQGNSEVARLMADAGTYTTYGCTYSSTPISSVPTLLNQFNLTASWPSSYDDYVVRSSLEGHRPLIFYAENGSITHTFICDGYMYTRNGCGDYKGLSFNWGWHEVGTTNDYNGFYNPLNWNPGGQSFNSNKLVIGNIHN